MFHFVRSIISLYKYVSPPLQVRVAVLGPAGVGKTSIIRQFLFDLFDEAYSETVEEMYQASFDHQGARLKLDILDTGVYVCVCVCV